MTRLEDLLNDSPDFLDVRDDIREERVKHLVFNVVKKGDIISMPLCGTTKMAGCRRRPKNVNCGPCLDILDSIATMGFDEAVRHLKKVHPKVITPDPKIIRKQLGGAPTINAQKHIKAAIFLKEKGAESPDDLILRTLGSERSFYVNLYQFGLIDRKGKSTGHAARDIASGKAKNRQSMMENE